MFRSSSIQRRLLFLLVSLTFCTILMVVLLIISTGRNFIVKQTVQTYDEEHQNIAQALDSRITRAATVTQMLASTLTRQTNLPLNMLWQVSSSSMIDADNLVKRVNVYAPFRDSHQVIIFEQPLPPSNTAALTRLLDTDLNATQLATLDVAGVSWWEPAASLSQNFSGPVISAVTPYYGFDNQPAGLVWVDLPVQAIQQVMSETVTTYSQSRYSYTLLVNEHNVPLARYQGEGSGNSNDAPETAQLLRWVQGEQSANFIDQFSDWGSALVTSSSLPQTGWKLIMAIPANAIYNPINDNLLQIVIALLIGLFIIYSVAKSVINQRIAIPLTDLTNAAQEIGSGEMRYLIGYQNQRDEIGKLAKALEYMKTNLVFSYDELARWSRTLEQRVNQRTRELESAQKEAQATAAELQAVYDASISLVSDYQLSTILQNLTERIADLLSAHYAAVWLLTNDKLHMQLIASTLEDHNLMNLTLPADKGLAGMTMREGQPIIMEDYAHWRGRLDLHAGVEQALCVPLMFFNKPIGAVLAGRKQEDPVFNLNDQRLLTLLANLVSPMVRNAQLYARLGEAMRETKQANEVKTRFLASVTHELRTPLNLIINNMDFMRIGEFGVVGDEQIMRLGQTIRSAEHLLYLINDLLDVSKIEAGEMQLFIQMSDPYPMLEDALDSAVALLDEGRTVALQADIPENLPQIPMDARRIRQVVTNLLSNAIKFTAEGDVKIQVRLLPEVIEFGISDTGMGIPDDELDKMFKMFERTNRARQMGIEGTGLGLPISRYLVEAHGGEMIVTTEVGKGSTFTFTLPRYQAEGEPEVKRVTTTMERMQS